MNPSRRILAAATLAVVAVLSLSTAASAAPKAADEMSSQRHSDRRYAPPRYNAPVYNEAPRYYRGGAADPSIAPDGRPYRVPEYLRNQCYVDDGYGRFSACSNR